MVKQSAQFVPIKLNAEKEGAEVAKKYGVRGYPTILFIDPSGEIVGRIGGYMKPRPFAAEMAKILTAYTDLPLLEAKLKESPDDGEANARIATIYAGRGKAKEAQAALERAEKAGYKGPHLASAYNAVGDLHQNAERFDEAIALFQKADAAAENVEARAYAKTSIMFCHVSKKDRAAARKVAQEIVDLKDCPSEYVEMAKRVLEE